MTVLISIRSRRVKFTIGILASAALGIVVSVRSRPRIRVERMPIASTVPTASPYLQTSPTRMGLSANRLRPPIRFSTVGCAARAMANPPTPSPATIPYTGTPSRSAPTASSATPPTMPSRRATDADEMGIDALGRDARRGDDRFGDHRREAPRHPCAGKVHDRRRREFDRAAHGADQVELNERQVGHHRRRHEHRGRHRELRQCPQERVLAALPSCDRRYAEPQKQRENDQDQGQADPLPARLAGERGAQRRRHRSESRRTEPSSPRRW